MEQYYLSNHVESSLEHYTRSHTLEEEPKQLCQQGWLGTTALKKSDQTEPVVLHQLQTENHKGKQLEHGQCFGKNSACFLPASRYRWW